MKLLLSTIFLLLTIVGVRMFIDSQSTSEKSVFEYSKSEYLELAVKNCSVDNPEDYCRCSYKKLLDKYTVREVLKFDADVSAQGEDYNFSKEQLQIVASCL